MTVMVCGGESWELCVAVSRVRQRKGVRESPPETPATSSAPSSVIKKREAGIGKVQAQTYFNHIDYQIHYLIHLIPNINHGRFKFKLIGFTLIMKISY